MADSKNCLQGKFLVNSEAFFVSPINQQHLQQCLFIEQSAKKTRSIRNENELFNLLSKNTCYGLFNSEKALIGYAIFCIILDEAELLDINLLKTQQSKGLGTALLKECLDILDKEIILEVAVDNLQAIKSYQKFNYQQIGIRKNYYKNTDGSKTDALVYKIEKQA